MTVQLLEHIRSTLVTRMQNGPFVSLDQPRDGIPCRYVQHIERRIANGTHVARVFAILAHIISDEQFRAYMFEDESPMVVITVVGLIEDRIRAAMYGRKPFTMESYTDEEIAAGVDATDRMAHTVLDIQTVYMAQ